MLKQYDLIKEHNCEAVNVEFLDPRTVRIGILYLPKKAPEILQLDDFKIVLPSTLHSKHTPMQALETEFEVC